MIKCVYDELTLGHDLVKKIVLFLCSFSVV